MGTMNHTTGFLMAMRALANSTTHLRSGRYASNTTRVSVSELEKSIQARCESRDLSVPEALGLLDSILESNPLPSIRTLNQLLGSLQKLSRFSTVVAVYNRLARSRPVDFRPDVCTLTTVINCLSQTNNVKLGFSVLGVSIKLGVGYNSLTVNSLLAGLCKGKSSMGPAMELFERIQREPNLCTEVTLGTIVNGLCKFGETQKALELLNHHNNIKPNVYCFSSVIDSLCKEDSVDEALSLFRTMIDRGVRPNVVCYTLLIRGLGNSGRRDELKRLLIEMVENKISPNVYTCTVLIDLLCKNDEIDEASRVFRDMVGRGLAPDIFCCNLLIDRLSKSGKWDEVVWILETMKCRNVGPNIVTFGSVLDGRFKEGNLIAGLSLVRVMVENSLLSPNYFPFLTGSCGSGLTEEAKILSGYNYSSIENAENNIQTLNIILNGLSSGFMMFEARQVFDEMVGRGRVGLVSFNILINGYCVKGEMDEAKEVFGEIEINGFLPNVITYNIVANGYLKIGRLGDALRVMKESVLKGLRPNKATRTILKTIHGYKRGAVFNSSQQQCDEDKAVNTKL